MVFHTSMTVMILFATVAMCAETVDSIYTNAENTWFVIDCTVTAAFTAELLMTLVARATGWRSFLSYIFSKTID